MRLPLAILVCLIAAMPALSEPMAFTIHRVTPAGRAFIAGGTLDYTLQEIRVVPWGQLRGPTWKKFLALANDFHLGMLVIRSNEERGFGMWIRSGANECAGFSWQWFSPVEGQPDIYYTRFGAAHAHEGQVRVTRARYDEGSEVQAVEFLTDITLQFQENRSLGPRRPSHEVVVSRGSVLRLPVSEPGQSHRARDARHCCCRCVAPRGDATPRT